MHDFIILLLFNVSQIQANTIVLSHLQIKVIWLSLYLTNLFCAVLICNYNFIASQILLHDFSGFF